MENGHFLSYGTLDGRKSQVRFETAYNHRLELLVIRNSILTTLTSQA